MTDGEYLALRLRSMSVFASAAHMYVCIYACIHVCKYVHSSSYAWTFELHVQRMHAFFALHGGIHSMSRHKLVHDSKGACLCVDIICIHKL